ncbi:HD domain-containing protein [Micromonospora echinospora]|uniref:HD domain-containing protein n=1 Tax=Micromonospora echinospora TaxID=1877 RepID=UPI0037A1CF1D
MRIGITGAGTRVPTDSQIRALHERFAPTLDAFDLVYTHCRIVCELAEQLLADQEHGLDVELVRAGCLLHDIGVYRLYDSSGGREQGNYVRHGLLGHELLRDLGFPETLCRFCSCHTGMGLSRDDVVRQRIPIPVDDYLAESDEERLVMYADKFHSKRTPPVFVSAATYVSEVRQFGRDKVERFAEMAKQFGEPDLTPLANEYGHVIV